MVGRRWLVLIGAVGLFAPRHALSDPAKIFVPCTLEPGPVRTVTRIVDGETLVLDDGKVVRLIGALAPRARDAGAAPGAGRPRRIPSRLSPILSRKEDQACVRWPPRRPLWPGAGAGFSRRSWSRGVGAGHAARQRIRPRYGLRKASPAHASFSLMRRKRDVTGWGFGAMASIARW